VAMGRDVGLIKKANGGRYYNVRVVLLQPPGHRLMASLVDDQHSASLHEVFIRWFGRPVSRTFCTGVGQWPALRHVHLQTGRAAEHPTRHVHAHHRLAACASTVRFPRHLVINLIPIEYVL
jgi:hypothetical protein